MEAKEYSKLKEVKLVEIEQKSRKKHRLISLIVILVLTILVNYIPESAGIYFGIFISLFLFITKVIIAKLNKEKFLFENRIDDNYIEIVYKNKLQAINSKVTCHPECNPVKIMQAESNRLYRLSNISDLLLSIVS
jgi:MFS superfamily sulfate permease-like transporter